ncbi:MAG TPA: deoxyribodipyrimidine photolyase [Myxococcales bacterium]|nr:deoxyribodipyrimidine photolyase [Myxococcales bacterium]
MKPVTLVWLRYELRVDDLPALSAAVDRGGAVVPVYVFTPPDEYDGWYPGAASRWWLHHSLLDLEKRYRQLGSPLVIRRGNAVTELQKVAREVGADRLYYTERVEPWARRQERQVSTVMQVQGFSGDLLWDPRRIETKSAGTYRVFTPFSRACLERYKTRSPLSAPKELRPPELTAKSVAVDALRLLPSIPWDSGLASQWTPGSSAAQQQLGNWVSGQNVPHYVQGRDRPAERGTGLLSPHFAFGELSVTRAWSVINARIETDPLAAEGAIAWRRQLIWREFARYLLWHQPHTVQAPLDARYGTFPWRNDPEFLGRWQKGQTGFPMVDAAMRQLWRTGWMHNRARMIVASFLVKDGLLDWRHGAHWFWDTLVDADLANNTMGWQWAAGCGADAAPFFRVFNPLTQSKRYDPQAVYLKRWLPELSELDPKSCHEPSKVPVLAPGYASPIVDHKVARLRALAVWKEAMRAGA